MASAQITFERNYGWTQWDQGMAVIQTTDSGYFIAGYSEMSNVEYILNIKTDLYGITEWNQPFTLLDGAFASEVIQQYAGKYCIIGGVYVNEGELLPSLYGLRVTGGASQGYQTTVYTNVHDVLFRASVAAYDGGIVMM